VLQVSGTAAAEPAPVNVNAVVAKAVDDVQDEARERRAEFRVDSAASLPQVLVNAHEIEQAIENLLRNAIESAESGARVDVSTHGADGSVTIRVSDDGRGVPVALQERIFEPFFTTRQDEGGTGLGLSLVRAIVHSHDGQITFDTVEGRGTRVEVALPTLATKQGGAQ